MYVLQEDGLTALCAQIKGVLNTKQDKSATVLVTLSASGWKDSMQTVSVAGVSADETKQLIHPTPSTDSQAEFMKCGVICTKQADDSLTFTAMEVPKEDLTVYVVIQEVGA